MLRWLQFIAVMLLIFESQLQPVRKECQLILGNVHPTHAWGPEETGRD
jgi:hypothetical protein